MIKVLITDNLSDTGLKILENDENIQFEVIPTLPLGELKEKIQGFNAIIIRSATEITRELLQSADKLELVVRAGIGVDNVDLNAATEKGVLVANTPHSNSTTTAEHTFALITSLARNIPQATESLKKGKWDKKKYVGVELRGKTLGLIGLGNIGTIVAKIASGYLMKVITYDPFVSDEYVESLGVKKVPLDALLSEADIISLHCPKTDSTHHIIDEATLSKMKPSALLVNCARGGLIDENALLAALENNIIAGAALDVFEEEPPGQHPLFEKEKIIMTPHLGASTKEAQTSVSVDACLLLSEYSKQGFVSSALNLPVKLAPEDLEKTTFITLAEQIGRLQGQLLAGVPKKVVVEYFGDEMSSTHELLQLHTLKEMLKQILTTETINFLNVKMLAAKRGIDLVTSQVDMSNEKVAANFSNLLRVRVFIEQGKKVEETIIAGSVLGENYFRILQINEYYIDFMAVGHGLLITNKDKPGVVGHVGTILANHNINISRMSVSLPNNGDEALAVYSIDSEAGKSVIDEILSMDNIDTCQAIYV